MGCWCWWGCWWGCWCGDGGGEAIRIKPAGPDSDSRRPIRIVLARLDEQRQSAEPDAVAGFDGGGSSDVLVIEPGARRAARVLDGEAVCGPGEPGVPPREQPVVEHDVRARLPADDD